MKISVIAFSLLVLGVTLLPSVSRAGELGTPAIEQLQDAAGIKVNVIASAAKIGDKTQGSGVIIPYKDLTDDDDGLGCFFPYGENSKDNRRSIAITDQAAYQDLSKTVGKYCSDNPPKLVPVDFTKNIILGIKTIIANSDSVTEKYTRTVRRDDQDKKISYFVNVTPGNNCDMCYSIKMNWIMIPIPPQGYAVDIWADTPDLPAAP